MSDDYWRTIAERTEARYASALRSLNRHEVACALLLVWAVVATAVAVVEALYG